MRYKWDIGFAAQIRARKISEGILSIASDNNTLLIDHRERHRYRIPHPLYRQVRRADDIPGLEYTFIRVVSIRRV